MSDKLTYKMDELSELLGVSRNLLYKMFSNNELPGGKRFGRKRIIVSRAVFDTWLNKEKEDVNNF